MAVGARSAIALQPVQPPIDKIKQTAKDGNATFPTAIIAVLPTLGRDAGVWDRGGEEQRADRH
jgi:hypothetical protein